MQSNASLQDRYTSREGRILITGVQALVRLMLVQADLDRRAGLRTGGFVSGYRGSPLGTLDQAFAGAGSPVNDAGIVVRPAVNEELAATAITGTQQIEQTSNAKVEGVFALWYGKGPGLDRAADAIRHGNVQGSSPKGGVVVAVGDDHLAKSSSIACVSDDAVAGMLIPLFFPADAHEVIAYGLHGFALSRHTGSWTALKILPEVADATHSIKADEMSFGPALPAIDPPTAGLHNRWPEMPLEQEVRQRQHRLPAVLNYVRTNKIDRMHYRTERSRLGIVAAGKSWLDLTEGLRILGLPAERLLALDITLYKPAMIWPLEPEGLKEFALGLQMLVVVEEKGPFIEQQIKALLYGRAAAPQVFGKSAADGTLLFPATADLTPERIAVALGEIIDRAMPESQLGPMLSGVRLMVDDAARFAVAPASRKPFFCSGCPHNRSTMLPDGSRALSGIGCHALAAYNRPAHAAFTQMGGEGVPWVGLAPFTNETHVFANMGDGTYFHSGLLAIRQAVAAGVNITYKILYNSAVAMTGGQALDGELSVERLIDQLRAEGIETIAIATEDLDRYAGEESVRAKVERIVHRDELDALQRTLRERTGVSIIVYDQMCATEKRRLRKRGKLPDPSTRVFINELVCEGCGDCSVRSGCLSVEPKETPFGVKRRINQSSCNKDYSCVNGFCPSFVSVEGGKPRHAALNTSALHELPLPAASLPEHQRILVAGIGGTGVVTIGALLSMSAHIAGVKAGVLDQVGMAQKGGAVLSHIHIARGDLTALRIPAGQADLILACDEIVGNARDVLAAIKPGRTHVLANEDVAITGDFTHNRDAVPDAALLTRRIRERAGADNVVTHPFTQLSEKLLGDAIGSNLMMVGFAYQKSWLVLDERSLRGAIALNGAAVAMNEAAFAWGRRLALDAADVYRAAGLGAAEVEALEQLIARRVEFLTGYQDRAYAGRFAAAVERIRRAEAKVSQATALTAAAARSLFKLMAYKDEYEVARLYTDGSFAKALSGQFEGDVKLSFHLAPPILGRRDPASGHLRKQKFGSWMMGAFRLLARLKRLRGTRFDLFGYTAERKAERAIVVEFQAVLGQLAGELTHANLGSAIAAAELPQSIRGYGHIKEKALLDYRQRLPQALAAVRAQRESLSCDDEHTHAVNRA